MNLFKDYTYSWQQIGVFKLSLFSIGVIAGTYWQEFFNNYINFVVVIAVATTAYIMYVSMRQW